MIDILLDPDNNDLLLDASGNIKIGNSDEQHQALLLLFDKGSLKEIDTGVGAFKYLEAEQPEEFLREVRMQFTMDGMEINQIVFENNKLLIDAPYND